MGLNFCLRSSSSLSHPACRKSVSRWLTRLFIRQDGDCCKWAIAGAPARRMFWLHLSPSFGDCGCSHPVPKRAVLVRQTHFSLILISCMLAACNTTSTSPGDAPSNSDGTPAVERGIVGEWNFKATDSVLSCRLKVSGKNDNREGSATGFGCIGLDEFLMVNRWKRERGTVEFFRLGDDRPVAAVYRVSKDEFRGELLPSGREVVLTRR